MFTATLGQPPVLHRQPPLEQLVNKSVCGKCNSGWMSDLEVAIEPVIQRLVHGEPVGSLGPPEIELLARWVGKTAAVLSHVTPQLAKVPIHASRSLHPSSAVRPRCRVFYCKISADITLEGGFLQLVYGSELGLVGTEELPGTRITLCIYNHCFTVDFPPMIEAVCYDLRESCSGMLWPIRQPAGLSELSMQHPTLISEVLFVICNGVKVGVRIDALS